MGGTYLAEGRRYPAPSGLFITEGDVRFKPTFMTKCRQRPAGLLDNDRIALGVIDANGQIRIDQKRDLDGKSRGAAEQFIGNPDRSFIAYGHASPMPDAKPLEIAVMLGDHLVRFRG